MDATTTNDVLRNVLIIVSIVLGIGLIIAQIFATLKAAKAAKEASVAAITAGDVTGPVSELVKGLATSAPLLSGGIVLLFLAAVLTGSLSFTASAGVGDDSGTSQSTSDDSN